MDRILHDANNAQRILKLTADTMLLVDRHGVCVDIEPHCDLWFLQENILLGKNIFELLPEYTKERVMPIFQTVLEEQRSISKNFKLVLKDEIFYFKCLMFPYDGMVLCQYRDITQRSNVKRRLEQANLTLRAIQKIAQIGQWAYNTNQNIFHYLGYTGVLCEESVQNLAIEKYVELIVEEDRQSFIEWCHVNEKELNMESISYRVRLNGEIFYMRIQTYLREERPDGSFNIAVSWVDGKKFYNSPADYARMREVSDRLCREYAISVIENPGRQTKDYAEWRAKRDGKPTHRGTIRADIDRAIRASTTERDFLRVLDEMGYQVKTHGKDGKLLKYPALKPPDAKGYFRFHKLGEGYTLEEIRARILRNIYKQPPFPELVHHLPQHYRV